MEKALRILVFVVVGGAATALIAGLLATHGGEEAAAEDTLVMALGSAVLALLPASVAASLVRVRSGS